MKLPAVFGSVATKVIAVLLAMGGIIAACVYVAFTVSNVTVKNLSSLNETTLPELIATGELKASSSVVMATMLELLTIEDTAELELLSASMEGTVETLRNVVSTLPEDQRAALEATTTDIANTLTSAFQARISEFEVGAQLQETLSQIAALETEASTFMEAEVDRALKDLETGGAKTNNDVDATLRQLIDQQVSALKIGFAIRAAANLASGSAISITQTQDPELSTRMQEIDQNSVAELRGLIPQLVELNLVTFDADLMYSSIDAFEAVIGANRFMAAIQIESVLKALEDIDLTVSSVIDQIVAQLNDAAAEASINNSNAINGLLSNQVKQLTQLGELDAKMANAVRLAWSIATAPKVDVAIARDQELKILTSEISASEIAKTGILKDIAERLSQFQLEETGLAAQRIAALEAHKSALEGMQLASKQIIVISDQANGLGKEAVSHIGKQAGELLDQASNAKTQFRNIGLAALAITVLSIAMTFLWIVRPMLKLSHTTERLADGDLAEVTGFERDRGEVGRIAKALKVFRDRLVETKAIEAKVEEDRKSQMEEQHRIVQALAEGLRNLSDGDLSHKIRQSFPGEYETLRNDFNEAIEKLRQVMGQIVVSGETVKTSSNEISSAAQSLAARTEKSAAALENSSNALGGLSTSIQQSSLRADSALKLVSDASDSALSCQEIATSTVSAMSKIATSSTEVQKITDLIDDIAFQTNLLALNAGVEAARAGEAGKGFSVVASEVRALAQRAADAAQDIGRLMTESGQNISEGVLMVERSEGALVQIGEYVERIKAEVIEIAETASQQSQSVSKVNSEVENLDQDTQHNAALFEQTTAASVSLNEEAVSLARMVSGFRVDAGHPAEAALDAEWSKEEQTSPTTATG